MTVSRCTRTMMMLVPMLCLAACGGGTMNSYDSEKARIRGALPSSIICEEPDRGELRTLRCESSEGGLRAEILADGTSLDVGIYWRQNATDAAAVYDNFLKAAEAYGLTASDQDRCVNEGHVRRQEQTYVVECRGSPTVRTIEIRKQTRV